MTNDKREKILKLAADFIAPFEGFVGKPYKCPGGVMTFGYGSLLRNYRKEVSFPMTKETAKKYLRNDLNIAYNILHKFTIAPLNENQEVALMSFIHNLGGGNYHKSTLRRLLNQKEYDLAAKQFPRWNRAAGKVLQGLVRRRNAEMELFLTPADTSYKMQHVVETQTEEVKNESE